MDGGKLQIPGGKTEPDEPPVAAVVREAGEELGINISAKDVEHLTTVVVKEGGTEYFAIQFRLLEPERFDYKIMEPEKCSELVWADEVNLPTDTIELFKAVIRQTHAGSAYIEIGY